MCEKLPAYVGAEVCRILRRHPRYNDARRDGDQQGWDLTDKPVADCQDRVDADRLGHRHAVLACSDRNPADDVDDRNNQAGDCVALHEFHRAVHRTEKLAFLLDIGAAAPRLFKVNHAGPHVSIDRHLFAGHRVK